MLNKLKSLREKSHDIQTVGLSDAIVEKFLKLDPRLGQAIDDAVNKYELLHAEFGELLNSQSWTKLSMFKVVSLTFMMLTLLIHILH